MAPSFWTSILSGILVVNPVLAGSRAWESSIVYTQPSNIELNGNLFGQENSTTPTGSTGSAKTLKKRYVTINPGTSNSDDRLWPNGKILYCFESTATKQLFLEDLVEARKLWEMVGLGAGFDWVEKDSSLYVNCRGVPRPSLATDADTIFAAATTTRTG